MKAWTEAESKAQLDRVRALCLALPESTERPSHGGPGFFVRDKRLFVMFVDDHHDDGRLALWCAAPDGAQHFLIDAQPDQYFRPPYVGHRGWIGVHVRSVGDDELARIVEDAYRAVAPAALVRELDGPG